MNLNEVRNFEVLVIGDAIEDRYRFCTALGKGTKESVIAARFEKEEVYRGGVWATASHLTDLVKSVSIWHGDKVTVNTKYLDVYNTKLFSVHEFRSLPDGFNPSDLSVYDIVIVNDFGTQNFLDLPKRERIMKEARYLAVNAQSNSLNYGFNRVNEKWPYAHLCVCDELEARLAAHEPDAPIEEVILRLPYPSIIVTQGAKGITGYANHEFYREGAATDRPIDLLGAGDAVLAIVAPFAKAGFSIQELVKLGNAAGAAKVGILGHRTHVTKEQLEANL